MPVTPTRVLDTATAPAPGRTRPRRSGPTPTTSNLNLVPGRIAANLTVLPTRAEHPNGRFWLYNKAGDTHVAADLAGYFVVPLKACANDCLYAWGASQGKTGAGTTRLDVRTPTPVHGLTDVVASSGRYAVRADGTVWAWGGNNYGELGNGWTGGESPVPVRVQGLTNVVAIAETRVNGLALRADGTVWAWGSNRFGGLGNGVACDWVEGPECQSKVPVQVSNLTDVVAVAAMVNAGSALTADGQVMVWGSNTSGEFGDPAADPYGYTTTPRPVPGLTGGTRLDAAEFGARAIVP